MLQRFDETILDRLVTQAGAHIDAATILALPAEHEFVDGDALEDAVLLVAPSVAQDVLHDFEFGHVVDASRDIGPVIRQLEVVLLRTGKPRKPSWPDL